MTDADTFKLLELLAQYGVEYTPDVPLTVPALAEDLATTMSRDNKTTADGLLGTIRRTWGKC